VVTVRRVLIVAALIGCAFPSDRAWQLEGEQLPEWQQVLAAVEQVTPDRAHALRAGGTIHAHPGGSVCGWADPSKVTGCAWAGGVFVRVEPALQLGPSAWSTALAHELCHQGLLQPSGAGFDDEAAANACAAAALAVAQGAP
jgi:hypothetical protein